ncbi:titin-like isoform X5 [Pecten maximus]|uniref:titin-like isoform X5 n=1 Tax=Pecten maximus TaxID=6579 RepID=UPI001458426E|nr:titin-like isoform X5 [Pecten maximus]
MKMVAINTRISDDQFPVLPKPTYQPGSFDPLEDHRASRPKGSNILHRQLKRLQRQHSIVLSKVEKEEKHERLSRRHEEEENRPKDSYRKFDGRKGHRKVVSKREKSFLSSCTKLPDINNDKEEIFRRHSVASLTSEEREDRSLAHRSVQSKYSDETDDRIGLHHFRNVHSKYSDGSDNKIGNQSFRNVRSKYSDELDDRIRSHRIHNVHPKYNDKRDDHIGKHPLRNVYSKYSDERDDRIGNYRLRTVYSKYSDDTDDRKLHHHRTFSKYESNHQSTAHSSYQTDSADYENKLPDIYPGQNNSLGNCTHQLDNSKRSQLGDARETLHQRNNGLLLQRSEINNESRDYFKLVQQRFGRQQRRRPRNVLLQRAKEKRRQCRNVFLKYSADLEDRQKLRRLGSGLLPPVVVDSHILTHMLSLLDGQKKKVLLDTDFIDDKSSEHSGSFKGKARRSKGSKGKKSLSSSRDDKEYVGNVPVVAMRSGASSPTTLPLIPGTLPLPPIGEASREQTSIPPVVLPPIGTEAVPLVSIQPPTPQHTFLSTHGAQEPSLNTQAEEDPQDQTDGAWGMGDTETLRQRAMEQERRRKEEKLRRKRGEGPTVSGGSYLQSSSESLGAGSTSSIPVARPIRTNWKGSNQSLRSIGSKKADSEGHKSPENEIDDRSGDDGSLKGSVIFGPDGQVISVGGAIQPSPRIEATGMIDQVTDANRIFGKDLASDESDDEPEEWKHSKALRRREVMRREIDYTSGDIDATRSMKSWSYMSRDNDTEIMDVVAKCKSLPEGLASTKEQEVYFRMPKDITILSRATEKTEDYDRAEPTPAQDTFSTRYPAPPGTENLNSSMGGEGTAAPSRLTSVSVVESTPLPVAIETPHPDKIDEESKEGEGQETRGEGTVSKVTDGSRVSSNAEGPAPVSQVTFVQNAKSNIGTPPTEIVDEVSVETAKVSTPVEIPTEVREEENTGGDENTGEDENLGGRESKEKERTPHVSRQQSRISLVKSVAEELEVIEQQEVVPESVPESAREGSVKSQISEEDIVNALTEHAQQVAASVLSAKSETGKDLEADVRQAAEMWMERHPPRQISRSQSIQENHESTVIDEIMEMQKQKRKSAGPTAGEYRELIKDSLTTAMKAQGLNDNIPDDTEITQEVIEALTNGSLTPDDLELVHDSDSGRSVIRSRSQLANAMGGVKQGHIYVAGSKNGKKAPGSIPVDRTSNVDVGEFDVIKYGTASQSGSEKAPSEKAMSEKAISEKAPSERAPSEKAPSEKIGKSQPPSIMGESIVEEPPEVADAEKKSTISFQSEAEPQVDEFKKAVEEIEEQQTKQEPEPPIQEEPKLPDEQRARSRKSNRSLQSRNSFQSHQSRCSHFKSDISKKSDEKSTRSAKSRVSDKKSKVSDTSQKGKSELEKRDEFVVGKVKQTNELEQLYGPVDPPSKEPTQPSEPEEKESTPEMPQKKVEMPRKKADIPPKKPPETPKKKEEPKKIVVNPPQEEEELSTIPEDGKPNFKGELEKLFGKLPANKDKGKPKDKKPKASPPLRKQKEKAKKGKGKAKAKKEEEKEPEPPPKEPTPPPPKEPTPPPPAPEVKPEDAESVRESIVDSYKSEEESDFEFNIVRDSPSPEPIQQSLPSLPSYDDNTETENEDDEEDRGKKQKKQRAKKQKDEAARLRQISNREARAAKRAAQAEKRRQEVDRRRRERDEQAKREKEEWERQELLKQELEEARKRNEENRRRRRELEAEENAQELLEEEKRQQQLLAEQERERRRREEYQRKLEEMKRKQIIEEQKRQEEMMRKMKEEEERRLAEEEMMAKMAEEERIAYEEKKRREEEERKRKEEEERIKREEEAKKAMEEARKLAEEMARRQAELEARLKFNHTIQVESSGMTHSQSMTRAFVFSYYELLSWLGLDIPEFELLKLNQY